MVRAVLDACFLIALRDCKRLDLLTEVAEELSWKLVACEAVYAESTVKAALSLQLKQMVSDSIIEVPKIVPDTLLKMRARYPSLGAGEIESLSYAVQRKDEDGEPPLLFSDDRRARKAATDLGIPTVSMLDFLKKIHRHGIMTSDEIREFLPELSQHMWLTKEIMQEFLKTFP